MAILEAVIDEPEAHLSDYTNFAPAAAMLLLAEFREERAYPLLVEMAQLDADLVDHYFDAKLIDVWPRVLASTSGGDVAGLKTIIEHRQAAQWVRSAAVDAMAALMLNDMLHREELIGYFRLLYQEKIDRQSDSIWNSLVPTTLAIHPGELIEEVQTAFEEDLVDAFLFEREEIEQRANEPVDAVLQQAARQQMYQLVNDAYQVSKEWLRMILSVQAVDEVPDRSPSAASPPQPAEPVFPEVGRNEPCPCGSGAKYKYCHGKPG